MSGAELPPYPYAAIGSAPIPDPIRVLLADEDRAVELIVCAMKRWDSTKYAGWRDTSNGQQARLQAAAVLAALRKEANGG